MWHIHRFTETERVYAPPVSPHGVQPRDRVSETIKAVFGVTTIISRCCICGKLQTVEVLGDAFGKPQNSSD